MSEKSILDYFGGDEIEKNIKKTSVSQYSPDVIIKMAHSRMKEACIPVSFFNVEMSQWQNNQDSEGRNLSDIQSKQKRTAGDFVRKYIKILPYVCRGKSVKMKKGDHYPSLYFNSLCLVGGKASGKTMLGALIAKECTLVGEDVKYFPFHQLIYLSGLRSFDSEQEQRVTMKDFENLSMIVVDDIDMEAGLSSNQMIYLKGLALNRVNSGMPYIITASKSVLEDKSHPLRPMIVNPKCVTINLPSTRGSQ
jgi:chromosomal replication initiation ATPase DnaA